MSLDPRELDLLRQHPGERPRPPAGLLEELLRQIPADLDVPLPTAKPGVDSRLRRPWSFRSPWLVAASTILVAGLAFLALRPPRPAPTDSVRAVVLPQLPEAAAQVVTPAPRAQPLRADQEPSPPATRTARPAELRRQNAAVEREVEGGVVGGVAGGVPGGSPGGILALPPAEIPPIVPEMAAEPALDALEKAKVDLPTEDRIASLADESDAASDRDDAAASAGAAAEPAAERLLVEPTARRNADGTITVDERWRLESPAVESNSFIAQEGQARKPAPPAAALPADAAAAPFATGSYLKVHLLPEAPEIRAALENGRWPDTRNWRRPEQAKKERQAPVLVHPLRVLALDLLAFLRQDAKSPQKAEELLAQARRLAAAEPQDPAAAELRDLIEEAAALARSQAGQS
jgi:hypothetical protein